MRIGIITGEFPPMPGGVGQYSRLLAERIAAAGHEVSIMSRRGTKSETLPLYTVKGWSLACLPKLRAWARDQRLDIVSLQYQTAAYDMSPLVHFLPRLLPLPVVTTFHDLRHPYLFPKAGPLRDWVVRQLARSSRGVISTNHEDSQRLSALPRRRMIPLGSSIPRLPADAKARSRLRRKLGADCGSFLLGFFGFIKAIKGVHFLLEAMQRLRQSGHDLRLVFIGERSNALDGSADAEYLARLDQRIKRSGMTAAVHATGALPSAQVAAFMQAVDLMVLPFSDGASFGRSSLIAALHQGCATVSTRPTLTIDDFRHGHNLWLAERESTAALEAAIAELMRDQSQLRQLRQGASQLGARFHWDGIASDALAFFESLLG